MRRSSRRSTRPLTAFVTQRSAASTTRWVLRQPTSRGFSRFPEGPCAGGASLRQSGLWLGHPNAQCACRAVCHLPVLHATLQFGEEAVKEGMGGGGGGGPADIFDLFGMGGGRRAPRERRSEDVVHK